MLELHYQNFLKKGTIPNESIDSIILITQEGEVVHHGSEADNCLFCGLEDKKNKRHADYFNEGNYIQYSLCEGCENSLEKERKKMYDNSKDILENSLRDYLEQGRFPSDAIEEAFYKRKRCVFCHSTNNLKAIYAPQDQFGLVMGENQCCDKCDLKIKTSLIPNVTQETCVSCGENYPISRREDAKRTYEGTRGEHWCNSCLVSNGADQDTISKFVVCQVCGKKHEWQITLMGKSFNPNKNCECKGVSPQLQLPIIRVVDGGIFTFKEKQFFLELVVQTYSNVEYLIPTFYTVYERKEEGCENISFKKKAMWVKKINIAVNKRPNIDYPILDIISEFKNIYET